MVRRTDCRASRESAHHAVRGRVPEYIVGAEAMQAAYPARWVKQAGCACSLPALQPLASDKPGQFILVKRQMVWKGMDVEKERGRVGFRGSARQFAALTRSVSEAPSPLHEPTRERGALAYASGWCAAHAFRQTVCGSARPPPSGTAGS